METDRYWGKTLKTYQNVLFFAKMHFKFAKRDRMTTKRKVSSKNSIMASYNADFFADFEVIEVVLKNA
jgi:hypothetical protein